MSKNFDELPAASALGGTETFPLNQAGVTRKSTINAIIAYMGSIYDAIGTAAAAIVTHLAAYAHADIDHTNRAALNDVSGTNTGDQDIAAYMAATYPGLTDLVSAYTVGTWLPTDATAAGLSLTSGECHYVKIGNLVKLTGEITYPTTTDTTVSLVGGLPFDPLYDQFGHLYIGTVSSLVGTTLVQPGQTMRFWSALGSSAGRLNSDNSGKQLHVDITYICQ